MTHSGQRTIIILGMHRSGTSMLAGSLEQAGLALGNVVTDGTDNRKGNRENRAVMAIHEDLLERSGGSWDNPPDEVRWCALHREVRSFFISVFRDEAIWGFKDPRTLFTVDGWIEALPDAEFVGIFRHPVLVALSLQARNGFGLAKGLRLWQRYNERLLHLHDEHRFPIVEFEDDPERLRESLIRVSDVLDLPYKHRAVTFFEDGLRQKLPPAIDFPGDLLGMYHTLKAQALGSAAPQGIEAARSALAAGNLQLAYDNARDTLLREPASRDARVVIAEVHRHRGEDQDAFEQLTVLIDEEPTDRRTRAALVQLLLAAGEFELAADVAAGGIDFDALDKADAPLLLLLAEAFNGLDKTADARGATDLALHLSPILAPSHRQPTASQPNG
jgi:hypothetical protein